MVSIEKIPDYILSTEQGVNDSECGLELTRALQKQGINVVVSKIKNDLSYYLIEYEEQRVVFSTRENHLLTVDSFQSSCGQKYLVPLTVRLEFIKKLWKEDQSKIFHNPVLIVGQFERIGSTWLMDFMDIIGRGQTEPLRQHVGQESPISTLSKIIEGVDSHELHPELEEPGFAQIWTHNFLGSQYQPERQITKETNLFFTLGFYADLFPEGVKILYLKRDIRGIISSFKKGGLYDKWNYHGRYRLLVTALNTHKKDKYLALASDIDESNWLDVLLFLYVSNLIQIYNNLFDKDREKEILELTYENMVLNKRIELDRIQEYLGSNVPIEEEIREVHNNTLFNTSKKKDNPFDWEDILTKNEEAYIRKKMCSLNILISDVFGNAIARFIEGESFAQGSPNTARGTTDYASRNYEVQFSKSCLSREEIIKLQKYVEISSGTVLSLCDGVRQLSDMRENVTEFKFANRLVTNLEFTAFLNFLHNQGFRNSLQGHYIYYNINMPSLRGGRITFKDNQYFVEEGYEDHPVNWVSWIGAKTYATWVNARLPRENEWDRVASLSNLEFTNFNHSCSDTTAVHHYDQNNLGIHDMFGNLRVWAEDWYHPNKLHETTGISKVVKGLSWNSHETTALKRTYKPVFMSARSIGIRLVEKSNQGMSDRTKSDLVTRHTTLHNLLESGIRSGQTFFDVNKELDVILND